MKLEYLSTMDEKIPRGGYIIINQITSLNDKEYICACE